MEFAALLEQLGAAMGLEDLRPDADGQCALLFDGEHEVTFTPDIQDHSLILHCEVGSASALDRAACLALMQASLLGAETGGAALSVHTGLDKIILWKRYDENFQDLVAVRQAIDSFLPQVMYWKGRLGGQNAVLPEAEAMPSDSALLYMGMFV